MMTKISKRLSAVMFAAIIIVGSSFCAFAQSQYKLIDDALLFSDSEFDDIESQLEDLSAVTGWDTVIYTNYNGVESYDMEDYCNNYYDESGFGKNQDYRGILLTIDMSSREMYIITKGDTMYYFNDDRVDEILDDVYYYLSEGEYYDAAQAFIDDTYDFYSAGIPTEGSNSNIKLDTSSESFDIFSLFKIMLVATIISLIVAYLSVVLAKQMYKNNGKGSTYDLGSNSTKKIIDKQDVFLHKSVSVRTVSSSSSGSGRSGGGGRSSSHGGGGRSF